MKYMMNQAKFVPKSLSVDGDDSATSSLDYI